MPPAKSTTLAQNEKQAVASSLPTAAAASSPASTPSSGSSASKTTISASEFQCQRKRKAPATSMISTEQMDSPISAISGASATKKPTRSTRGVSSAAVTAAAVQQGSPATTQTSPAVITASSIATTTTTTTISNQAGLPRWMLIEAEMEADDAADEIANTTKPSPAVGAKSTTPAIVQQKPTTTPSNKPNNASSSSSSGSQSKNPQQQLQPSNSNSSSTTLMPFECPVCLEEMAEPKLLHCGHNLCGVCETKLLKKQNGGGKGGGEGAVIIATANHDHNYTVAAAAAAGGGNSKPAGGGGAAGALARYLACPLCAKVTRVGAEGLVVNYTVKELVQRAKVARQEEAKLAACMEACELCMRRSPRSEMFTCMAAECLEEIRLNPSPAAATVANLLKKGGSGSSTTANDGDNDDDDDNSDDNDDVTIYRGCRPLCAVCACKHHKGHTHELIELAELASDTEIEEVTHSMRKLARKMPLPLALDGGRNEELSFLDPIREVLIDQYQSVYASKTPLLKEQLRMKIVAFESMADMSKKFLVEQITRMKANVAAFKPKLTVHLSALEKTEVIKSSSSSNKKK